MKVNRKALLEELRFVTAAAERKATIPVLMHVLWRVVADRLELSATNMELSLRSAVDVEGGEDSAMTVPAKAALDLLGRMTGESVEVEIEEKEQGGTWRASDGSAKVQLAGFPASDFPTLPDADGERVEVDATRLRAALATVEHSICKVESRFNLLGAAAVLNGAVALAGSDGHRLATYGPPLGDAGKLPILPINALQAAAALAGEKLAVRKGVHHWSIKAEPREVIFRKLEGTFPDVERLIRGIASMAESTIAADRKALAAAIQTAAACPDERGGALAVRVEGGALLITRQTTLGEVRVEVPAEISGGDVALGFTPSYLLDLLAAIEGDDDPVTLRYQDSHNALYYEGGEGDQQQRMVVMPRGI